jgi:hypothetical protein
MLNWLRSAVGAVTGTVSSTIAGWVHDVVAGLYSFLHVIFGDVGKAWHDLFTGVEAAYHALDAFGDDVAKGFYHLYRVLIPGILAWIRKEILDPLLRAVAWIAHEGATIWHYISNPGDLVDLIWDDIIGHLEQHAVDTAEKLGKWLFTLITKNAAEFAKMIEDILDAIL